MTTAILTFLGVIAGAVLQYFFTRHLENQKHYRGLRTQAYTDYLKCVSELAQHLVQPQSNERTEIITRTTDAKTRICLYGSSKAVEAFSIFEKLGASMKTVETRRAFTNMVAIMRSDSGSKFVISNDHLEIILFGHREQ